VRQFYVYVLSDPVDGNPFYVGKGCGRRWRDHLRVRPADDSTNPQKQSKINDIIGAGREVAVEKVLLDCEEDAFAVETDLILTLGCAPDGPLLNRLGRGFIYGGVAGKVRSSETRAKMSLAAKRRWNGTVERKVSEAARANITRAMRGRTKSPETRAKIGHANRGRKHTEESKMKMRAYWAQRRESI
jgi:hypothetical protein